jgi:hypothetical protein
LFCRETEARAAIFADARPWLLSHGIRLDQDRTGQMAALGIPLDIAESIGEAQSSEMGRAVLLLYRSARQPAMAQAGRALENAAARPGLSLLAT